MITADHGNDPTWRGNDHTREHVPILAFGAASRPAPIGARASLADIAETIAEKLGLPRRRRQELAYEFRARPAVGGRNAADRRLALCRVLLMNDARYPWLILVPRRAGLSRSPISTRRSGRADRGDRARRGVRAAPGRREDQRRRARQYRAAVACARGWPPRGDPAWPGPVWGVGVRQPYVADVAASGNDRSGARGVWRRGRAPFPSPLAGEGGQAKPGRMRGRAARRAASVRASVS